MARKTPARDAFAARVKKELKTELEKGNREGRFGPGVTAEIIEAPKSRKEKNRERLIEMGDSGLHDVRETYRLALHHHETQKRRMKAAKRRVADSETDVRLAAENVPFDPSAMTELAAEMAKRIINREAVERDLKRTRANLKAATEAYVAFEEEDLNRGT